MKLADDATAELIQRFDQTDALNLPQLAKDHIKLTLLRLQKTRDINVAHLADEAEKIDVTTLENLLVAKAPKKDVFAAMKTVSAAIARIATEVLAGKEMIGPDDRNN